MPRSFPTFRLVASLTTSLIAVMLPSLAAANEDLRWSDQFTLRGVAFTPSCVESFDGSIYIGSYSFSTGGSTCGPCRNGSAPERWMIASPTSPCTTASYGPPATAKSTDGMGTTGSIDVAGRHIRNLHQGRLDEGSQQILWDGRDDEGAAVPTGVYFVALQTESISAHRKVVLTR